METTIAVIVLGALLGDAGMPSRQEREWHETEMNICAAAGEVRADLDLKGCVDAEVKRKRARLMREIQSGSWTR